MKYHHQQGSTPMYFFIGIVVAALAMAVLSDTGNIHAAVSSAEAAVRSLLHILAS